MKIYWTIHEVANIVGAKPYVLRFWEKEIPHLIIKRNSSGRREYKQKQIQRFTQLRHLIYEEGISLKYIKQQIQDHGIHYLEQNKTHEPNNDTAIIEIIGKIDKFIESHKYDLQHPQDQE